MISLHCFQKGATGQRLQSAVERAGGIFDAGSNLYPTAPCRYERDAQAIGSSDPTKSRKAKIHAF
jgi:hypothetical protein